GGILLVFPQTNPVPVGHLSLATVQSIVVLNHYAYLTGEGFRICDISNPTNPVCLSTNVGGLGLALKGVYSYVAYGQDGVHIYSISNPEAPVEIKHIDNPYNPSSEFVQIH